MIPSNPDVAAIPHGELIAKASKLERPEGIDAPWRVYTALSAKWGYYSLEIFFREALEAINTGFDCERVAYLLQRIAKVTLKPEGLVGGRLNALLRFLHYHGFKLLDVGRVHYSRYVSREIWRYQWNTATLDRIALSDFIAEQGPALEITVLDTRPKPPIPGTLRLRSLKGSAVPELRSPSSMRSMCGAPNRVLSIVHTVDEPADIIRELGITKTTDKIRQWLEDVIRRQHLSDDDLVKAAYEHESQLANTTHDLDFEASAARLAARCGEEILGEIVVARGTVNSDSRFDFREWKSRIVSLGVAADPWDIITVGSYLVQNYRYIDEKCIINDDGRLEWAAGLGKYLE